MQTFLDFFCQHSTAVYRFHLARRGDEQQAQALTDETFRAGLRSIDPDSPEEGDTLVRLMTLARSVQALSRPRIHAAGHTSESPGRESRPVSQRQPEGRRQSEGHLQPVEDTAALHAQIAFISGALRRMPPAQADALALYFFAGLSPAQTASALRASSDKTSAWMQAALSALCVQIAGAQSETDLAQGLLALAGELQPAPAFVDGLEERLSALSRKSGLGAAASGLQTATWRLAYGFRASWGPAFSRLAPLGLLALALAAGFYLTLLPTRTPTPSASQPSAAPTRAAAAVNIPAAGWLVPLDLMSCETWRNRVTGVSGSEASLDSNIPFNLPSQSGVQANGTACEITVTVSNAPFALEGLSALLNVQGYNRVTSSAPNRSGVSQSAYQSPNGWVLLTDAPVMGAPGEVPPTTGGGLGGGCDVPGYPCLTPLPAVRTHTLYLDLSYDPISAILAGFSRDWIDGNPAALNLLSTSLRQRVASISDLDQLLSYQRSPTHSLQFNWHGLENAGKYLRLEATVEAIGQAALPSQTLGRLQILLAPDAESATRFAPDAVHAPWRIQDISPSDIYPATNDAVLAAGTDGQLVLIPVDSGQPRSISGVGFYQPDLPGLGQQMRISPDGRWLALNRSDGAWLLSLTGRPPRHLSMEQRYSAWAADSRTLAFFRESDRGQLYTQEVPDGAELRLAHFDGRLTGLSWSPYGDFINAAYLTKSTPADSSGPGFSGGLLGDWGAVLVQTRDAVVNTTTGDATVVQVHPFYFDGAGGSLIDPLWSADNRELWFVSEGFAANPLTGVLRPLGSPYLSGISSPRAGPAAPLPGLPLWQNPRYNLSGSITAVSPDSKLLAVAYYTNDLRYADILAVQQYASGKNLWIRIYGKISLLDWTEEGSNLIAVENIGQPGLLRRVNPLTGESIKLADQMIYISLRSTMIRNNQPAAPALSLQAFPYPGPLDTWHEFSISGLGLSLRLPPDWDYREMYNILGRMLVVGSSRISAWDGWSDLGPDRMFITFNRIQMKDGQSPQAYLEDVIRHTGSVDIAWEALARSGQPVYRLSAPPWSNQRASLVIPYKDQILWITKYPAVSTDDWIFANILNSLRIGTTSN